MTAMGFRVEPTLVHFAVVKGTIDKPIVVDVQKFGAPKTYSNLADQLVWYRKRVVSELNAYKITCVGIRFPESSSRGAGTTNAMWRLRIEGVVMEASAANGAVVTAAGGIGHIKAKLGASRSPKDYMTGAVELRGINMGDYNKNTQEAILIAISALAKDQE